MLFIKIHSENKNIICISMSLKIIKERMAHAVDVKSYHCSRGENVVMIMND